MRSTGVARVFSASSESLSDSAAECVPPCILRWTPDFISSTKGANRFDAFMSETHALSPRSGPALRRICSQFAGDAGKLMNMTAFRYRCAILAGLLPALAAVSSASGEPPTATGLPSSAALAPAAATPPAPAGTDALDSLVKDSPFMPAASGGAAAGQTGPLELRGVIVERGSYAFSLYDLNSKESYWVGLNETGFPVVVRSYDAASDTVTVEQQGRTLSLTLAAARTMPANPAMAAQPAPGTPGAPGGPVPQPTATPGNGPTPSFNVSVQSSVTPDEAQRLQRIADEIRRRRAVGKAAPTPSAPSAPSTPPKS
jgi:hypothetical protein